MSKKLQLVYAQLNEVSPNPWNPHGTTEEEMAELKASIGKWDMKDCPLVVEFDRPVHYEGQTIEPGSKKYLIVDGEQKYTAKKAAFMEGLVNDPSVPVLVMGKLSEFTEAELAELGQVLNHKGRGSLEDAKKTGVIVEWLTQRGRTLDEVAQAMGQKKEALREALIASQQAKGRPIPPELSSRPQGHKERNVMNVVLPFEDAVAVDEFESLVAKVAEQLGEELPQTKGFRRSAAVLAALRAYVSY